ncbi:ABC transporter substrate-binding protein [Arsenicicoccus sp. oral taxon 190]|uniref:ABC transporter substrate-binding protein n=1 Tax=Arsenicicoccus sp. oral taxon 190 TaxID=1658671 RepID=UPI00067A2ACD|nr:ABC transporter substrate-binding protein [Arsenicicoccus sp. oral taxon 190]AKT52555.1 glycine/betaine ABC transporter substrate-binding protein [Arsenicicoccus sp. oral taxon 190]
MTRTTLTIATGVALALGLSACGGGSDPLATSSSSAGGSGASGSGGGITVGSADFPESKLLAEIYAGALSAKGVKVDKKLGIGSRETYIPALKDGSIDVIPEYSGALDRYVNKDAKAQTSEAILTELKGALPAHLEVLDPAKAEDKDAVVMTKAKAGELGVTSIADLKGKAEQLTIGGPAEWQSRSYGIPGLEKTYGLKFKGFRKLDAGGPLAVQGLKNGQVDLANIFTTDPAIKVNDFVVLQDPQNFFAAQNVLPLAVKGKLDAKGKEALNAVSAKLDTQGLTDMLTKVSVDHKKPEDVATEWLKANSLG